MNKIALIFVFAQSLVFAQGEQRYADGTATDQDGNTFEWINYGTQDWAIENAKVVTYRDGTPIPQETDAAEWANLTTGAWCYYNNDPTKPRLYNWYAVAGIHDTDPNTPNKEFAPTGWHVPSDAEWTTLENYLIDNGYNYDGTTTGRNVARAMASKTGWSIPASHYVEGDPAYDQTLNNASGFNLYPVGYFEISNFINEGWHSYLWAPHPQDVNDNQGLIVGLDADDNYVHYEYKDKNNGLPARFVRNSVDTEPPVITILGDNPDSVNQGDAYTDPGVTVTDNVDGNLTSSIVVSSTVDTSTPGTYYINYNVTDSAGNAANQATRTVVVVETTPTLNAGPDLAICEYETVTLGEATASNYSSLYWTTSGDGAFNNPNIPNTSYIPGPNDIARSFISLTLNAQGSNGQVYSDTVVIEIEQEHIIELTSSNSDQIVDEGTSISPITFSLGGGATAATISGLPVGISYTLSLGVITIAGTPTDDITEQKIYYYNLNTTGNDCTISNYIGTIIVNPVQTNPTETGIILNGTVSAENNQIKNVADPTDEQDAATKAYADAIVSSRGLMNFSGWGNYQVWNDNTTVNLTPNSFVFLNADNTTLVLPDNPENCCFGDVIYVYVMRNANSARPTILKSNNLVIRVRDGNQAWSGQSITGVFQGGGGLQMIINVGDYWMAGSFESIGD